MKFYFRLFLFLFCTSLYAEASGSKCQQLFKAQAFDQQMVDSLSNNKNFTVDRGLGEVSSFITYNDANGERRTLVDDVIDLRKGDHIIDSGAGDGGIIADIAISKRKGRVSAFSNYFPINNEPIRMTALSFIKPDEAWNENLLKYIGTENEVRYLDGRFVEEVPHQELTAFGKAKLLLDSVGPLAYTDRVDVVLQTYVDVTRIDGGINIYFGKMDIRDRTLPHRRYTGRGDNYETEIRLKNGKTVGLLEWLKTIKGLRVLNNSRFGARIEKLTENVVIPRLELVSYEQGTPPFRIFREVP